MNSGSLISVLTSISAIISVAALVITSCLHWASLSISGIHDRLRVRQLTKKVCDNLRGRPTREQLAKAWEDIFQGFTWLPSPDQNDRNVDPLVALFHDTIDKEAKEYLISLAREHANCVNASLCEMVDVGLVSPLEFIRARPDLHLELLNELALVAPVVWYQSLTKELDRWGYRVLLIQDVLWNLRKKSTNDYVDKWSPPPISGHHFCSESSPVHLDDRVRRTTISRRGKIAQNEEAQEMQTLVQRLGLPLPDPDAAPYSQHNKPDSSDT